MHDHDTRPDAPGRTPGDDGRPTVAVAHYPEGAGHATRMVAVAKAIDGPGAEVALAGGGPGAEFVEVNGYDRYDPRAVDYIGDFQEDGGLVDVLLNSVPDSAGRVRDYVGWLRDIDADAVVTDDVFAAAAAIPTRTPLYVVTHNSPALYDPVVEPAFTWLLTQFQVAVSRTFFFPTIWPRRPGDPSHVDIVPPLALDGEADPDDPDVLVVPSYYSSGFEDLAGDLTAAGHRTTLVGGPEWTTEPSLLPYMRAADVVVCSGYSSMMESAVAGTPCVVYPFTSEQRGVARAIEETDVAGFTVARSTAAVRTAVEDPPSAVARDNGVKDVAAAIRSDLGLAPAVPGAAD
ncbi:MAG: glycosyltransferase [Halobacteriaceae archaeon]